MEVKNGEERQGIMSADEVFAALGKRVDDLV
jgi:hypothetical protein